MERNVRNGGGMSMKLPVGFRFDPTDEELLLHYLRRKICNLPLPASVIPESEDAFRFNPWDLPGDLKEKRYFFCKRQQQQMNIVVKNNKCVTPADCYYSGFWKETTGKHKQIKALISGYNDNVAVIIGLKRSLVFYDRRHKKTRWMMQQFCLVGSVNNNNTSYPGHEKPMVQVGEWLVCRIYKSKWKRKRIGRRTKLKKDDQLLLLGSSKSNHENCCNHELRFSVGAQTSSYSSCSSGITDEISSSEDGLADQEEANSFDMISSRF